ncbi:MAG: 5,10-methylenetetrahydrofolate reductase [Pseudonocardiales bacterium]|nr:MAG: 5,10-methylenetetrahydrofolate reductase [Pseudonocardiales bacterium]
MIDLPESGGTGALAAALRAGHFAATAEIGPPRGANAEVVRRKAALLAGHVDAANITDNPSGFIRLSSLAGCVIAQAGGVEAVVQLTCRDRNRIALQSDLIGAGALGIPNVLLLTGDHPRFGDHPDAKPVFDLDGVQLTWTARELRDEGRLLSGRELTARPRWLIGAVENPFAPPREFRARRLGKKVAVGAQFVQTQFVFDVAGFADWMKQVRDLGLHERCGILAGVGPLRSLRALQHVSNDVPGVYVPDDVGRRLRAVPEDRIADAGVDLCVETIQQIREIPGVAGVHVMAFGYERGIPEILERAGVGPRTRVSAVAGRGDEHAR